LSRPGATLTDPTAGAVMPFLLNFIAASVQTG
jgi:hypothetical protein